MNVCIDWDYRWAVVLENLQHHNNLGELVRALVANGNKPVPDWVFKQLELWSKGKLPPDPLPLTTKDENLVLALEFYARECSRQPSESEVKRVERVAKKYNVTEAALYGYLDRGSRAYRRIRDYYRSRFLIPPLAQVPPYPGE
jgi:hypothetical protein